MLFLAFTLAIFITMTVYIAKYHETTEDDHDGILTEKETGGLTFLVASRAKSTQKPHPNDIGWYDRDKSSVHSLIIATGCGPASMTMAREMAGKDMPIDAILTGTVKTVSADRCILYTHHAPVETLPTSPKA